MMEVSITQHHLDWLHEFVNEFETEGREDIWSYHAFRGAYWVDSSVDWTDKKCTMRAIKFLKTLLIFHNNAERTKIEEHLPFLFDDTRRYFWYLQCEIQQVFEREKHHHLGSTLGNSLVMIALLRKKAGKIYDKLMEKPRPVTAVFSHAVGFDEFTDSVQQYLMNVPNVPIGWGHSSHEFSDVEVSYKDTVQKLERFRFLVSRLSGRRKVLSLLDHASDVVFSILYTAHKNDVLKIATEKVEASIFCSSAEMSLKLLPHVLLASPDMEPVQSAGFEDMMESFLNILEAARKMARILDEFLEFPIMDHIVYDDNVEVANFLKRVYQVLVREAGSFHASVSDHAVLSNLLHKLHLIRCNLFVMELHNQGTATIRETFKFLVRIIGELGGGRLNSGEKSVLELIQAFLTDIASLCGLTKTKPLSRDMILESSLAFLKLFKAETMLMVLIHNTPSSAFGTSFVIYALLKSLTISGQLFTGTPNYSLEGGNVSTICKTLARNAASYICTSEDSSRGSILMKVSVILLLDKFHDFLNEFQNKVAQVITSSVPWFDKYYTMRAIKYLKTVRFTFNINWSGMGKAKHLASLFDHMETYFRWLEPDIIKVVDSDDPCHVASALSHSLIMIHILYRAFGRIYGEWMKISQPFFFVDGLVFDELVNSVQMYLMNVPKEPFGQKSDHFHNYSAVEKEYKETVQRLECFRYIVCSCTKSKKLQSLLPRAAAVVFSILQMAYTNDVEDNVLRSSYDMPWNLSPQNQDAMNLYLEVLAAHVEVIWASESSSGRAQSLVKSFHGLLQSAQNQAHVLSDILELPIMNLIVDDPDDHTAEHVEALLRRGYLFAAKKAACIRSHDVLSKLLHKLNIIKTEIFVLELHNHKANLSSFGKNQTANIRDTFKFLNQFCKTPTVYLVDKDKSLLEVIEDIVREAGLLCDLREEAMILESSLAIFKVFKVEAMLLVLIDGNFSLNFLAEFHVQTLQKGLLFLRESLLRAPKENLNIGNVSMLGGTMAENPGVYMRNFFLLLDNFPRDSGVAFTKNILIKLRKCVPNVADTFTRNQFEALLDQLEFNVSTLKDFEREDFGSRVTFFIYAAEYIIDLFMLGSVPLLYHQLLLFIAVEETKLIKPQIPDHCHDNEEQSSALPLQDVQLTWEDNATEEVIVGFDDRAKVIVELLKTGSNSRQVVSLVGMAGIGKTTLAQKVYNHGLIKHHFAVRARCCVSQVYRKREVLLDLLGDSVDADDDITKKDDNDLALKVKQRLSGRRYLIIVDDIWSIQHWEDLQYSFPDERRGSRILFTTRDRGVARKANPTREPYFLDLLSPQQSWDVLQEKLFPNKKCPPKLLQVGRLIAQNCRGLPLAIVVIAGILKGKEMKKDVWEEIAEHLRSRVADDQERHFTGILEFSYKYLPSHLKPCYLYMGSFLEDEEIPVKKLKWLWMGEGFIPKEDSKSLEETAEGYLVELINRSLIVEARRSSLGGVKTCRIHDMLRDLCLEKAKEVNFMDLITSFSLVSDKYRLCLQSSKDAFVQLEPSASYAHSLLFFSTDKQVHPYSYDISSNIQHFKLLRVLDLEPIRASIFPTGIDLILCLTYLAIKGDIPSVPPSIAKLWNLQILVVKGTRGEIALPSTVWNMSSLRHIQVRPRASLTLSSPELENAVKLENLTTFSSPAFSDWQAERIMKRWTALKRLRCIFMKEWCPAIEILTQLESLNLSYTGKVWPCKLSFPRNLKKLTLSRFSLSWKQVSIISQLSQLEALKLLAKAVEDDTWNMTEDCIFPRLKYLKMESLNLAKWNVSDCSEQFPELEKLVLRSCKNLEEIPSSFEDVTTLQMIEVSWCTRYAAGSLETILEHQVEYGNEDFQVTINPQEWDFRTSS